MTTLRQDGVSAAVAQSIGQQLGKGSQLTGTDAGTGTNTGTTGTGGTAGTGGTGSSRHRPRMSGTVWDAQAAYVLKNIRQEEERTVTYSLTQVTAQKQNVTPQSFVQFLADQRELNEHVFLVDLNHPFFQQININVNALDTDFAAQGITQMTVQLRYGKRPDGTGPKDTAEVILRSKTDSKDFTFFADSSQTQAYEYKLIVDYRHDFAIGVTDPREETDWIKTEARSLSVTPRLIEKTLPVTLTLPPNMPDDVTEVQARVHYASPAHQIDNSRLVHLTAQSRSAAVPIRLADASEKFQVEQTFFYMDGTKEDLPPLNLPDPASGDADGSVVISPPRANRLNADIIMQDPIGQMSSVLADLQVQQASSLVDSRTFELATPMKREVWSVRLQQRDTPATLRYRQRRLFKDGGIETDDWLKLSPPTLSWAFPPRA